MSVTPILRNMLEAIACAKLAALRSPPPWWSMQTDTLKSAAGPDWPKPEPAAAIQTVATTSF
jgi:hypothetical protein